MCEKSNTKNKPSKVIVKTITVKIYLDNNGSIIDTTQTILTNTENLDNNGSNDIDYT